jgi:hypothetical protein
MEFYLVPIKYNIKQRKTLYPELKKAQVEGKRSKIVRDKLIIEGQVFYNRS